MFIDSDIHLLTPFHLKQASHPENFTLWTELLCITLKNKRHTNRNSSVSSVNLNIQNLSMNFN
uniref:Uncharacterized protein n=1 Tax=Trichobilharzia regenti TaxID=157069 RepID=A0AA85J5K2_TRIRE|nr:unnamed protein product [Trichobilharzia regenti]